MFKIIIKNLKLFGYHGVNLSEKKEGQEFLFNISIRLNKKSFKDGGGSDDSGSDGSCGTWDDNIESTVNYSDIINIVKEVSSSKNYDLLETLSEVIALRILAFSHLISSVRVQVEKTSPPIKEKLESVGVVFTHRAEKGAGGAEVYMSVGSNTGDREKNLREAVRRVNSSNNIQIRTVSSIYETEPMYIKEQKNFYNIAVRASVNKYYSPFELLGFFKKIEFDMGRDFCTERNGPRIIDIDILLYDDLKIDSDILTVPHPKIAERNFVLTPLVEIAPELEINGRKVEEILISTGTKEKVFRYRKW